MQWRAIRVSRKALSTTMRTSGALWRNATQTSRPLIPGSRESSTRMSGRSAGTSAIACSPLPHSPTTSMRGSSVSTRRMPSRTSSWSSTMPTRTVSATGRPQHGLQRDVAAQGEAPVLEGTGLEPAAEQLEALAEETQAQRRAVVDAPLVATSVVLEGHRDLADAVVDAEDRMARARVLEHVLHPLAGQLDEGAPHPLGEGVLVADHHQLRDHPGVAQPLDVGEQVVDHPCRGPGQAGGGTDGAAQLAGRRRGEPPDLVNIGAQLLVAVHRRARVAGEQAHPVELLRHGVVELLGETEPLTLHVEHPLA